MRLPLFLLGGLAMAMAVITRSEGLFLLVPLLFWSFRRGNCAARDRALNSLTDPAPGRKRVPARCRVPGATSAHLPSAENGSWA